MDLLTVKIVAIVGLGVVSLIFGLIPIKMRKCLFKDRGSNDTKRKVVLSFFLCFGAGVLFAAVMIHIMPEIREGFNRVKMLEKSSNNFDAIPIEPYGVEANVTEKGSAYMAKNPNELVEGHDNSEHNNEHNHHYKNHNHEHQHSDSHYHGNSHQHNNHSDHDHAELHNKPNSEHVKAAIDLTKIDKISQINATAKSNEVPSRMVDSDEITDTNDKIYITTIDPTTENDKIHSIVKRNVIDEGNSKTTITNEGTDLPETTINPIPTEISEVTTENLPETTKLGSQNLLNNILVHNTESTPEHTNQPINVASTEHIQYLEDITQPSEIISSTIKTENLDHEHHNHADPTHHDYNHSDHEHTHSDLSEHHVDHDEHSIDANNMPSINTNQVNHSDHVHNHEHHIDHHNKNHDHEHSTNIKQNIPEHIEHSEHPFQKVYPISSTDSSLAKLDHTESKTSTKILNESKDHLSSHDTHSATNHAHHGIEKEKNPEEIAESAERNRKAKTIEHYDTSSNLENGHHLDHDHDHGEEHSKHKHESNSDSTHTYPLTELLVCAGLFLVYFIEELIAKFIGGGGQHGHSHMPPTNSHMNGQIHSDEYSGYKKKFGSRGAWTPAHNNGIENPAFAEDTVSWNSQNKLESNMSGQLRRYSSNQSSVNEEVIQQPKCGQVLVSNIRSVLMVLALSFHSTFEGLAIGLQENANDVWYLTMAVAAHKLVIHLSVSLELMTIGVSNFSVILYTFVMALTNPIGGSLGMFLTADIAYFSDPTQLFVVTVLQALAGGTILYVVFFEIMERERGKDGYRMTKFFAFILGFAFLAIIENFGGHSHGPSESGHIH